MLADPGAAATARAAHTLGRRLHSCWKSCSRSQAGWFGSVEAGAIPKAESCAKRRKRRTRGFGGEGRYTRCQKPKPKTLRLALVARLEFLLIRLCLWIWAHFQETGLNAPPRQQRLAPERFPHVHPLCSGLGAFHSQRTAERRLSVLLFFFFFKKGGGPPRCKPPLPSDQPAGGPAPFFRSRRWDSPEAESLPPSSTTPSPTVTTTSGARRQPTRQPLQAEGPHLGTVLGKLSLGGRRGDRRVNHITFDLAEGNLHYAEARASASFPDGEERQRQAQQTALYFNSPAPHGGRPGNKTRFPSAFRQLPVRKRCETI